MFTRLTEKSRATRALTQALGESDHATVLAAMVRSTVSYLVCGLQRLVEIERVELRVLRTCCKPGKFRACACHGDEHNTAAITLAGVREHD